MGRSYNLITHNGPGAGLYFEILANTQTIGGFEKMGMSVCQESPKQAAAKLRSELRLYRED